MYWPPPLSYIFDHNICIFDHFCSSLMVIFGGLSFEAKSCQVYLFSFGHVRAQRQRGLPEWLQHSWLWRRSRWEEYDQACRRSGCIWMLWLFSNCETKRSSEVLSIHEHPLQAMSNLKRELAKVGLFWLVSGGLGVRNIDGDMLGRLCVRLDHIGPSGVLNLLDDARGPLPTWSIFIHPPCTILCDQQ